MTSCTLIGDGQAQPKSTYELLGGVAKLVEVAQPGECRRSIVVVVPASFQVATVTSGVASWFVVSSRK